MTRPQRFSYDLRSCSIERTLAWLGDRWTLLVVREAFYGVRRFDHFAEALGCGRAVLSTRIAALTKNGVLTTTPYRETGKRKRLEYRLTEKGRALYPMMLALQQWGDEWAPPEGGSAVDVRHAECGEPVRVGMWCAVGHGALQLSDLKIAPGPGARRVSK